MTPDDFWEFDSMYDSMVNDTFDELSDQDSIESLVDSFREALHEDYDDAVDDDIADALVDIVERISPAEAFNLGKALQQIGHGANQAIRDPAVGQVAGTALPLAGAALGTYVGGPAGTEIGRRLGGSAASRLQGARVKTSPAVRNAGHVQPHPPAVSAGSSAAAQALLLTQKPEVLTSLLSLALGDLGKREVQGVPVASVANLLAQVASKAASDARELYGDDGSDGDDWTEEMDDEMVYPGGVGPSSAVLYERLMEQESREVAEAYDVWFG